MRDSYPMPDMCEFVDTFGTARVFFTFDANFCYWQFPVRVEDLDKTAFALLHALLKNEGNQTILTSSPMNIPHRFTP